MSTELLMIRVLLDALCEEDDRRTRLELKQAILKIASEMEQRAGAPTSAPIPFYPGYNRPVSPVTPADPVPPVYIGDPLPVPAAPLPEIFDWPYRVLGR